MNIGHVLIAAAISSFVLIVLPMVMNMFHNHPEWRDQRKIERSDEFKRLVGEERMKVEEALKRVHEEYPEKSTKAYFQHVIWTVIIVVLWMGLLSLGLALAGR